ncbi:MAG: glycosyltransferase family 2 protein [Chloracidobacterium sp.]|nr:glycosyltransferase family 2 protein [Chloracidobacterium sp.]
MKTRKIEIITPVHNRREETLQCLRSLARIDKTGLQVHIIVVDDGSTDGTAEAIAADFPDVEIIKGDGNLWYTAGTNRGLEAALRHDPDYILAINNDSIFDEKCILSMVKCAEKYPRSIIGSLLLDWSTPHRIFQVAPRWELLRGGYRHWFQQTIWTVPERPWEVELIVGNCVLYPAKAVRDNGLMDEKHLVQYGDAEYTPRMRRRGWRLLIEPRARTFCKPNDPATGFRKLSLAKKLSRFFFDSTGPYSFRRKFYGSMGGAPNLVEGLLAIPIYYLRLLIGKNTEGAWALQQHEEPLSKTFAAAVIDE